MTLSLRTRILYETSGPTGFLLEYRPKDLGGALCQSGYYQWAESSRFTAEGLLPSRSPPRLCAKESKKNHPP